MRPLSESERDAALDRLSHGRPSPAEVTTLADVDDRIVAHAVLRHVADRLAEHEPGWGHLVPADPGACPPESVALIAELHLSQPADAPLPIRDASVPGAVAILWGCACLVRRSEPLVGPLAFEIAAAVPWTRLRDPIAVLDRVLACPPAQRLGVDAIGALGRAGRAASTALEARLSASLDGPHADRGAALMAEPWAASMSPPVATLLDALDGPAGPAAAAALAAHRALDALVSALSDDARSPAAHDAILTVLGDGGTSATVHAIVDRALADPARHADRALGALHRLRRHGIRIETHHVGPIVELWKWARSTSAENAAEVLDAGGDEAIDAICARLESDPGDPQLMRLLATSSTAASGAALARIVADPRHAPAFTIAAQGLIERAEDGACAEALVSVSPQRPTAIQDRIRSGGRLVADRIHIADARLALRFELIRGAPIDWPDAVATGRVDAGVIDALTTTVAPTAMGDLERWVDAPSHPFRMAAIAALGRLGGLGVMAPLARALADDDDEIVEAAAGALTELGRRGAGDARQVGLVAGIERALRGDPEPRIRIGLLSRLAERPHRGVADTIRRSLRHRDADVRRAATAALGTAREPQATAWLLSRGLPDDPRVARAQFEALGRRGDPAASAVLCAGLEHPLMNLKKTAATALATAGARDAVPSLVFWLGRHDNPGLRASLTDALDAIAGDSLLGVVRADCDRAAVADDDARVDRLALVLDGRLSAAELATWIEDTGWGDRLARLVFEGPVRPTDGGSAAVLRRVSGTRAARPASPDDAMRDTAARAARQSILGWEPDDDPGPVLKRLGHLRPRPAASNALIDRACALYRHASAAGQSHLLALFAAAARTDPIRRFRIIDTLRHDSRDAMHDATAPVMVGLGALPDEGQRRRWSGHRDGRVRAAAERACVDAEPHEGAFPAAIRRRLFAADRSDEALRRALDGHDSPSAVIGDLLERRGPAAALDACRAVARGDRWVEVVGAIGDRLDLLTRLFDHASPPADPALIAARVRCATRDRLKPVRDAAESGVREAVEALATRGEPSAIDAALRHGWFTALRPVDAWEAGIRRAELSHASCVRLADRSRHMPALDGAVISALLGRSRGGASDIDGQIAARLRQRPFGRVWPHLVDGFTPRLLAALAPTRTPPGALISAFAAAEATDRPAFLRWFAGAIEDGPLHAPGLRDVLLERAAELDRDGWRLVCSLLHDADDQRALIEAVRHHVSPDAAAEIITEAVDGQPASLQIPLLLRWRDQPAVVDRLASLWAGRDARARRLLPPEIVPTLVRHRIAGLSDRDPEGPRQTLSALVEVRPPGVQVIDLLAEALDHRHPRVRAHAHRLLRRCAPRDRYLRETRRLLVDRHPSVMRRAVRVACYGGDLDAVRSIVPHLASGDRALREAAHAGLVYMGPVIIDRLRAAAAKARPDRRLAIERVVSDIEAGAAVDVEDDA